MVKKAEPKEILDDSPRFCMFHKTEMTAIPPDGSGNFKKEKVLKIWVCTSKNFGDKPCSYKIYWVE